MVEASRTMPTRGLISPTALALLLLLLLRNTEGFSPSATRQLHTRSASFISKERSWHSSPNIYSLRRRSGNSQLYDLEQKEDKLVDAVTPVINGSGVDASGAVAAAQQREVDLFKSAIQRTLLWVAAAGAFGIGLLVFVDSQTCEEFFAGYLLEQSLSVDNLLVFLLLFEYFKVPDKESENRVLNWGIIGAIIMRAIMIGAGAVAIQQFHAVLLLFAGILIYSSAKVLLGGDDDEEEDLSENQIIKFSNNLISSTDKFDGDRFFTMVDGVRKATPLFLCMVAVEISDVVFAVDSIPAVFGVTNNPLVVFSSNIFAIMGLRSLYTILSKAASELKYLEPAVAVILGFIGVKLVMEYLGIDVPTELSLGVVLSLLGLGIGASVYEKSQVESIEE